MTEPGESFDVGRDQLGSVAGRGIAFSYSAQVAKFILQIGYQIAIARILVPEQFGIVAMASPVIAFIGLIADLGLSQAAIQRRQISDAEMSTLFWTNFGLILLLSAIVIAGAPAVAQFYGQPAVAPVLAVLAATTIVGACGSQHLVMLNRQLRFGTIAVIDLISFIVGAIVSLAAALSGLGIWAIVINQVVIVGATTIALWSVVKWRPVFPRQSEGARQLIGFGSDIALANTANFLARNLDNVLIGKFWGDAPLGAYDRAYKLLLFPLSRITTPMARVAVPLLSRVQHDERAYRKAYFLMLELILGLTYPGAIMALVAHDQLIRVLLGEKWAAASPIFAILAVGALFAPISNSMSWLLISQGRTRLLRDTGVASSVAFALGIVAGLPWGPVGVAAGYIGVGLVQGPVTWVLSSREGPVDLKTLGKSLFPFMVAGTVAFGASLALQRTLPEGLASLILIMSASYVAFLLTLLAQPRTRETLFFLIGHIRGLFENRVRI